jgi:hypothetical protein
MDVERIIDEIQQIQGMFEAPDIRSLSANDLRAANRRHDETMKCSRIVRGSGFGSGVASVAALKLPDSDWVLGIATNAIVQFGDRENS